MVDKPASERSDIEDFLRAIRRRWRTVVACWVAVTVAVGLYTFGQEKSYAATAGLLFRDPGLDQKLFGTTFLAPNRDPEREAATNVKLVSLDVVSQRTARRFRGLSAEEITEKVEVAAQGQSDIVDVTATDRDPRAAARLANAFAREFIAFRRAADREKFAASLDLVRRRLAALSPQERNGPQERSLRERADQLEVIASLQTGNAELVQTARAPDTPDSPKVKRNIALGLLGGLLLGLAAAILLDRLDRRIREPDELEEALGYPTLASLPASAALSTDGRGPEGAAGFDLPHAEAEAFRMLRARMRYFNVDREIRVVLVTSASAGEGKSTVCLNLAAAAATSGTRTLLLESDLRRPTLAQRLQTGNAIGLSELLTSSASVEEATRAVSLNGTSDAGDGPGQRLDFISAGFLPPNPSELLESHRMLDLLHRLTGEYDLVVVDSPPLLVVSDAIPLMTVVDGVIIVSRLGVTTRDSARQMATQLAELNAPVLGVVVNGTELRTGSYYGYAPTP